MEDTPINKWISQLLISVVCCLLLSIPVTSQAASISGAVTKNGGGAIKNVDVWACIDPCGALDWKAHDYTDALGEYNITGLIAEQEYKIKFFTTRVPEYVAEWYNDKSNSVSANPVTATEAGTLNIDAILEIGSDVTGAVKDTNGDPIAGVTIFVRDGDEWISSATTTDIPDGNGNNYTLSGLSTSRDYYIFFYANNIGYPNEWYNNLEPIDGSITVPAGTTTINGGATRVDAVLGDQQASYITGKVVDTNGDPIADVTVSVRDGDDWVTSATTTGILDGNGNNYTLSAGLSPSRDYHIYFDADDIAYPNEWYNNLEPIDGSSTVPPGATTVNGGATRVDAVLGDQRANTTAANLIPIYMLLL
uniref:carboxypeptidase-like regulatory domain-containing protein n=1 Tax=Candidatus Electrothrix sp. TaxID=2170559 RepID=UPI00405642CE